MYVHCTCVYLYIYLSPVLSNQQCSVTSTSYQEAEALASHARKLLKVPSNLPSVLPRPFQKSGPLCLRCLVMHACA